MKTLQRLLQESFWKAYKMLACDVGIDVIEIMPTQHERFGHYQCNASLRLAKEYRQNSRVLADRVVAAFDNDTGVVEKLEVAGPGFINITLSKDFLSTELMKVAQDPYLGSVRPENIMKVIVEFSSPNIAKELHVGHLRSTIIGESLARIMEFFGHDVLRLNHVGDWGTQFGMLIYYLKKYHPEVVTTTDRANLEDLVSWYKKAKEEFDYSESFKKCAQEEVIRLQSGDKDALSVWKHICDISRKRFTEIYVLLEATLEERGESFYNPFLSEVIDDFQQKGLITLSEGAKCVFMKGFCGKGGEPFPLMIQKSDGGYNYATTDLAAMKYRVNIDRAQRILVVTDGGQKLHFAMVEAAAKEVGYLDPSRCIFEHVPFGVVLNEGGKKFKTRSGETIRLIDLLEEAIQRARTLLVDRLEGVTQKEIEHFAKILGINAVKYADLSSSRTKDYIFSFERMLQFQGNTAVFLLYAYVRICSIQRKVGKSFECLLREKTTFSLEEAAEVALGLHLRRFGEVLELVNKDLTPHYLAEYLYALAEKFNLFFRDCRVEGHSKESSRLLLCALAAKILAQGLHLLGMETLEKM